MKFRIYCIFLSVFFTAFYDTAGAQSTVYTAIGQYTAEPGDTLEMPVLVSNISNVHTISLKLMYNPLVLSYLGYSDLNPGISLSSVLVAGSQPGQIFFTYFDINSLNIPDTDTLVVFKVVYNFGATWLTWDLLVCDYTNLTGNSFPATYTNGNINGGCPPFFNHTISYSVSLLSVSFSTTTTLGSAPYTYVWAFGDGQLSNLQNPVHTYSFAGNFYVTLTATDALFCQDDTTFTLLSGIFTPIPEGQPRTLEPKLFPNPVKDCLTLDMPAGQQIPCSFSVCDLSGKMVIQETNLISTGSSKLTIQVPDMKPGVYSIRFYGPSGILSTSKFIILNE